MSRLGNYSGSSVTLECSIERQAAHVVTNANVESIFQKNHGRAIDLSEN